MKGLIKYLFFSFLLGTYVGCDTDSNVAPRDTNFFIKYYGGSGNQFGKEVLPLTDGFILLGTTRADNSNSDILVIKTDLQGNEIWSSTFTEDQVDADDIAMAIVELGSGFIVVGNSVNSNGNIDILVLNISATGEELNQVTVGDSSYNDEAADVIITQAGNIMIAGASSNTSIIPNGAGGTYDFYFPQLLPDLTLIPTWTGRYGFSGEDKAIGVRQKANSDFVFLGSTDKEEQNGSEKELDNMIMFQVTDQGLPNIADVTFGTAKKEIANDVTATTDGGFLFVGSSTDAANSSNIYLSRIRQDNSVLGSYEMISDDDIKGKSAFEAQGGGYIVMGDLATNTGSNIYMTRTTNSGAVLWERTFGIDGVNTAEAVLQLADGSYVFIGSIYLDNQSKMCLIKTNENGDLAPL